MILNHKHYETSVSELSDGWQEASRDMATWSSRDLARYLNGLGLGAVAYLHDVLEDTGVTPRAVEGRFGFDAEFMVAALTCPATGSRSQRHRAKRSVLRGIRYDGRFGAALLVALADRLANVRRCARGDDPGVAAANRRSCGKS